MTETESDLKFKQAIKTILEEVDIKFKYSQKNDDVYYFKVGLKNLIAELEKFTKP